MSATTTTGSPTIASDAAFRALGSLLSAAIATAGLVQTADTGQINWSTVTRAAAGSAAGYEIWRFNDSLQSTAPVFVKVEYGSAVGSASLLGLWFTVGTGSDGAGNLTSAAGPGVTVSNRNPIQSLSASDTTYPTTTGVPIWVNGDGSTLMLGLFFQTTGGAGVLQGGMFLVERMRDWNGTPNGDGLQVLWCNASSVGGTITKSKPISFNAGLAQVAEQTTMPGIYVVAPAITTVVVGSSLYPLPQLPLLGGKLGAPSAFLLAVAKTDVAAATQLTIAHYGSSHLFGAAGNPLGATSGHCNYGGAGGWSYLLRVD